MQRRIIGYLQGKEQQWVLVLECGHTRQVSHDPLLNSLEWLTTEEGRMAHVGTTLECGECGESGA